MASYTIDLREILEAIAGSEKPVDGAGIDALLNVACPKLFDFSFPFWSSAAADRLAFEKRFCKHFFMREIGVETMGLFKLNLDKKFNEVLPKYNGFYKMLAEDINALSYDDWYESEMQITKTGGDTTVNSGTDTSTRTDNTTVQHKDLYSDTPQGNLSMVESGQYLTTADFQETTNSVQSNASTTLGTSTKTTRNDQDTHKYKEKGKKGGKTYGELMKEMVSIDTMFFDECEDLFMGLW